MARLLEIPEKTFERDILEIEANPLFALLRAAGVIAVQSFPGARFAARRFAGRELRSSSGADLAFLDGRGELFKQIEGIGQENFERCFLRDETLSDEERAAQCGISHAEAGQIRQFVDAFYIQADVQPPSGEPIVETTYSAVAAIEIDRGQPVLAFFNREIWKGQYIINAENRRAFLLSAPHRQGRTAAALLRRIEHLDYRKSTLYATLEFVVENQAAYFVSRDPGRRRPLTQRAAAAHVGVCPSVINRLISNKSIQLPWGCETPMRDLFPSARGLLVYR